MNKKKLNVTVVGTVYQANVITHPAPHHADEVMAIAILGIFGEPINVYRTFDTSEIYAARDAYIVDVGGAYDADNKRFDHHMAHGSLTRSDGSPYASAGLVWQEHGVRACMSLTNCSQTQAEAVAEAVDKILIKGIDAADYKESTSEQMSVATAISMFNPVWNESTDSEALEKACQLAYLILTQTIECCVRSDEAKMVDEAIRDSENGVMILPQHIIGWQDRVLASDNPKANELLYVVAQTLRGHWKVSSLPTSLDRTSMRKLLPRGWHGLKREDFVKVTGVRDAVSCDHDGCGCIAGSQEGALKLARLAVEAKTCGGNCDTCCDCPHRR